MMKHVAPPSGPGIVIFRYMLHVQICAVLLSAMTPALADDDCIFRCPSRPGMFGSPEPDKNCVMQCLRDEETLSGDKGRAVPKTSTPVSLRFTEAWNENEALQRQRGALERLVNGIPNETFKSWVRRNIVFDRVSRGSTDFKAGISPGLLRIYDPFWDRAFNDSGRINVLTFELGKALWFDRINPGPREARPPRMLEFERIIDRHKRTIEAMKFAAFRGEDLANLTDLDLQSQFAYACRVEVLDLAPPATTPLGYSQEAWASIRRDWQLARQEMGRYLVAVLRNNR